MAGNGRGGETGPASSSSTRRLGSSLPRAAPTAPAAPPPTMSTSSFTAHPPFCSRLRSASCSRQRSAPQGREGHIKRGVQVVGQRAGAVLEDLNHRGGIVRDDDTSLRQAQETGLALGHTKGARGINHPIHIILTTDCSD